jgi:hypothetical protein
MLSGINGGRAILVNNYAARRSYIVLPKLVGDAPKSWVASGDPKLGFDCSIGVCVPAQFWTGQGYAYGFHGPKTKAGETTTMLTFAHAFAYAGARICSRLVASESSIVMVNP